MKGFTLIELLVVIAIIGILSSVVFTGITTSSNKKVTSKKEVFNEQRVRTTTAVKEPAVEEILDCSVYNSERASGAYEEIPFSCFEEFHITEPMLTARLKSLQPYEINPCNN